MQVSVVNTFDTNVGLTFYTFRTNKPVRFTKNAFERKESRKYRETASVIIYPGDSYTASGAFTFPTKAPEYELESIGFENLPSSASMNIRYGESGDDIFTGDVIVGKKLYSSTKRIDFKRLYGICPKFKKEDVVMVNIVFAEEKPKQLVINFFFSYS